MSERNFFLERIRESASRLRYLLEYPHNAESIGVEVQYQDAIFKCLQAIDKMEKPLPPEVE